ncbi:restriction endonuclease subunit S [Lactobacillus delbrueckii]|uniref:restriction endonuclease subunit S n=1 Tax=Lactobacillus delbrueckii TaxID=1584 RepID=UPI0025B22743|nr:restriction endonuclease subunit S [Lactobacillus delbrueckii]
MKDEKKAPKLRFKGFTDDWEQCKLGTLFDFKNGLNKGKEFFGSGVPIVNYMDINKNVIINADMVKGRVKLNEDEIERFAVKDNDLFFTRTSETSEEIGFTAAITYAAKNTVFSGFILRARPILKLNSEFYAYYLRTMHKRNDIIRHSSITTRALTSGSLLSTMTVSYPAIGEQNRISYILRKIDSTITLHEEKKSQLERLKSTLLQKMFADKSGYPAVRFSNFGDKWKQYKLSDIGEIVTGSTPPRQHPEYYSDNGVLWVTPTDITDNLISDTAKKLSVSGTRAGQVVPAGSILVTCIASIGKNALLLTEGSFNQQINCIVPNSNKFDSYFLLTESFNWLDPMRRIAGAGTMQIVNKNNFSKINTFIPELEEQIVIGNIFSKLDSLIALYKQKIEKINILKQWLLQNMFI